MEMKDFLEELDEEVATINGSSFKIEVTDTKCVPSFDDPNITYDNLEDGVKKCKRIETCLLHVDMRDSSKISAENRPNTLAKVYSSFVQSMIASARYFGGHVRGIVGDRVMVVFDTDDCFMAAVKTAVLMNTVSQFILNRRIKDIEFRCGIGIDHGKMLVTKAGAVRRGAEKEFYRGLIWLGRPANVASRLTDVAHKTKFKSEPVITQGNYYRKLDKWLWIDRTYDDFLDDLQVTYGRNLVHEDEYFSSFFKSTRTSDVTSPPILMTDAVYKGMQKTWPVTEMKDWSRQLVKVRDYSGPVYGGDVIFSIGKSLLNKR